MTGDTGSQFLLELSTLRDELERDLMFCTTRDAHLRLSTRLATLGHLIQKLEHDTVTPSDTVVP